MPIMASPRPFYPLQQPATAPSDLLSERSNPVRFQPRGRKTPVSVAAPLAPGSVLTSRFPAKLPIPRQSLRTTSLRDPAGSASSGTALGLSSVPAPPAAALRDAPRCQTAIPPDPSARSAV